MKKSLISLLFLLPVPGVYAAAHPLSAPDSVRSSIGAYAVSDSASAHSLSTYERHVNRHKSFWSRLTPNQTTLQYAGSIGAVSGGVGWHYGKKDQWETDFLIGWVPKCESSDSHASFTLRQTYLPFRCNLGRRFDLEPLTCGLFFNVISGEDFWASQPRRYPKKYYGFSTKIRAHLFVGQRITYKIPTSARRTRKSVSLYYQLSTCDLYLVSYFTNSYLSLWDILSLGVGIRAEIF